MKDTWPIHKAGIAHNYASPMERQEALQSRGNGLYYQRHDHETLRGLAVAWSRATNASQSVLFESGLAAASVVIKALAPGQTLFMDKRTYYEIFRMAMTHGRRGVFHFRVVDLLRPETFLDDVREGDVVWGENPANWYLDTFDIPRISAEIHRRKALLIVDTTLQPLQSAIASGADIAVTSLSKYPGIGFDLAGVAASNRRDILDATVAERDLDGHVLSNEAAYRIHEHLLTLKARLQILANKTLFIAQGLRKHPLVTRVRTPDTTRCGGLCGGQLSFSLPSCDHGRLLEAAIGASINRSESDLHLMTTFGCPFTTIEHFGSNLRKRTGIMREETNEASLPDNLVRIGVGYEDENAILSQLLAALDTVATYQEHTSLWKEAA